MENTNPQRRPGKFRHLVIIGIIAILLVVVDIAGFFPNVNTPLERVELGARDTAMRLRGPIEPHPDIVIVAIDDDSLVWVNQRWPWPRSYMAEIINWLTDAGARVIALDTFLFDPAPDPADDEALVAAFENANAVVTVNQIFSDQYTITHEPPLPIYQEVLDGFGLTEIERDDDAIVRSVVAFKTYQGEMYFNWSFDIASLYLGVERPTNISLNSLDFNGQTVPLNRRGTLLVNFVGEAYSYPTYSAAFVPLGDYPPEAFQDKIVFIGATSETMQDLYPTPFSSTVLTPGVEVVASATNTLISGNFLQMAPPWVTLVAIVVLASISLLLIRFERPVLSISLMFAVMAVYLVIRQVVFVRTGWQLAIVTPTLMVFLGVVAPTLEQAVTQELEKRRVRGLFSRFISPTMVDQLIETQDINSLNKRTELTILFSDIRSFTTISERLTPVEVVGLLNPYLQVMSEVIHKHGGTVDKYEGDAIVAFFGEPIPHPDHAIRAARASLEMRVELKKLTDGWVEEGRFTDIFEMGIGLNTGDVFVGLLGSEERVNYTIIGDAANLAARLQDQTKEFGVPILISGETNEKIQGEFETEFLEAKLLKGKTEPVQIYHLKADKTPQSMI